MHNLETSTSRLADTAFDLDTLPTPALVIDAAIVQRNIERLAAYGARHRLGLRPHSKTHKSRKLGRLQLEAGAVGLTVAKVGEAEQMMLEAEDLLLAYPAVDVPRCRRLAEIARERTVRVAIDSSFAVRMLAGAAVAAKSVIGLLVDIDVGMGRTGVATPEEALELARLIAQTEGVRLDGILFYPGHIMASVEQQAAALGAVNDKLRQTMTLWARHGLEAKIVSGGSTPTGYQSHLVTCCTEIRPGTYIFNDMNTVRGGFCTLEDCGAWIMCTVVSEAVKDQVVIDGGSKTFTSDPCVTAREGGHGHVVEYPEAKITRLSEEHGQIDVSRCVRRPKVGERVTVIPNHICPCVNLQDGFWWLEEGRIQSSTVDARGKLS